ncbi:MAG: aspartyl protease family protein [Rhodospirillales bacterium]|nr:aspartyl protease family protein [Rhodospirillales bacterium]
MIEGKPVTLLIDTGAEISLVTPLAMTALHLQADRHRRTTI